MTDARAVLLATVCSIDGCTSTPHARGWCNRHYKRWQLNGDPLVAQYEKANLSADCGNCGKAFHVYASALRIGLDKYCSRACSAVALGRQRRRDVRERLFEKVVRLDGCWRWTGAVNADGYGTIQSGVRVDRAHRVMWEITYGPIPTGLHVLHRCDNPPCTNPEHLWLGTHADNMADMARKGRSRWGRRHVS